MIQTTLTYFIFAMMACAQVFAQSTLPLNPLLSPKRVNHEKKVDLSQSWTFAADEMADIFELSDVKLIPAQKEDDGQYVYYEIELLLHKEYQSEFPFDKVYLTVVIMPEEDSGGFSWVAHALFGVTEFTVKYDESSFYGRNSEKKSTAYSAMYLSEYKDFVDLFTPTSK